VEEVRLGEELGIEEVSCGERRGERLKTGVMFEVLFLASRLAEARH
jgi:hypothetical protein